MDNLSRDGSVINPHAPKDYCIDIVKKINIWVWKTI